MKKIIFVLLLLIVSLSAAEVNAEHDAESKGSLEIYSQEFGYDISLVTYSYFFFLEPYAGLHYRIQFQGEKTKRLFIIGAGVRQFPPFWELLVPYGEIGFGKIKGRREVRCMGHLEFGIDIDDKEPRHGRITIEGFGVGIKGEFLSFRTRKNNTLSFVAPSASLNFETYDGSMTLCPNLGIEFFRMSFNIMD